MESTEKKVLVRKAWNPPIRSNLFHGQMRNPEGWQGQRSRPGSSSSFNCFLAASVNLSPLSTFCSPCLQTSPTLRAAWASPLRPQCLFTTQFPTILSYSCWTDFNELLCKRSPSSPVMSALQIGGRVLNSEAWEKVATVIPCLPPHNPWHTVRAQHTHTDWYWRGLLLCSCLTSHLYVFAWFQLHHRITEVWFPWHVHRKPKELGTC